MPKKIIECKREILIKGKIDRFKIVEKVVKIFIEFEKRQKGKEIGFKYPVEDLPEGEKLYIIRPGIKWNFDFKVEIPKNSCLKEGKHYQIAEVLRNLKEKHSENFYKLWNVITLLYKCEELDADKLIEENGLKDFSDECQISILLKVIKWLFIMEDIIYWHWEGRAFLYNFLYYTISETEQERLTEIFDKIKKRSVKPNLIKKLLKKLDKEWISP